MIIKEDTSLRDFEFWSGGAMTAMYLTDEQFDTVEELLAECYPDGMDATELNDFFWFDDDTIAEWLGYGSFEELLDAHREVYEENRR